MNQKNQETDMQVSNHKCNQTIKPNFMNQGIKFEAASFEEKTFSYRRLGSAMLMILALLTGSIGVQAKVIETKEVQILILFTDPEMFFYQSNIGGEITGDLSITNPPGSTYIFKGGLFPGGTIDPQQSSFDVDTQGNALSTENSIGTWICTGTRIINWNLSGMDFPAIDTRIEELNWSFLFKGSNPDAPNAVYSKGWLHAGELGVGGDYVVTKGQLGIIAGTGLNENAKGVLGAKTYLAPDGMSALSIIQLSKPISIEVPD
jgi:hypothetical protein